MEEFEPSSTVSACCVSVLRGRIKYICYPAATCPLGHLGHVGGTMLIMGKRKGENKALSRSKSWLQYLFFMSMCQRLHLMNEK